jgi:uncharacterized protein
VTEPAVRRNADRRRFEAEADGKVVGFLDYRESGDRLDLVHTEVAPEHQGRGFGERIVKFALDEAQREGRKVRASCSFVAAFIKRHPQYQPLVAD